MGVSNIKQLLDHIEGSETMVIILRDTPFSTTMHVIQKRNIYVNRNEMQLSYIVFPFSNIGNDYQYPL